MNRVWKIFFSLMAILSLFPAISYYQSATASKRADKEYAAQRYLREIYQAQKEFFSQTGNKRYGTLVELREAGLISEPLMSGENGNFHFAKGSYLIAIDLRENGYEAFATPVKLSWIIVSGRRSFYVNEQNVFTAADKDGERATADDEYLP